MYLKQQELKRPISCEEFLFDLGEHVDNEESILYWAWKNVDADDLFRRVESFMATKIWMNTFGNIERKEFVFFNPIGSNKLKEFVMSKKVHGSVLVVGAGIAGMQSALDLAESGYYVYLLERSTAIGGVMAQLDKTFPTNDCTM